jgi:hypothetical protein
MVISGGYVASVIESLKSATQGIPLNLCKVNPIRCAVAIGYVDQMMSGW